MKKGCGTNIQKYDTRKNRVHTEKISAWNGSHPEQHGGGKSHATRLKR